MLREFRVPGFGKLAVGLGHHAGTGSRGVRHGSGWSWWVRDTFGVFRNGLRDKKIETRLS